MLTFSFQITFPGNLMYLKSATSTFFKLKYLQKLLTRTNVKGHTAQKVFTVNSFHSCAANTFSMVQNVNTATGKLLININ